MRYLLDFDRTVFDTDRAYAAMRERVDESQIGTSAALANLDLTDFLFEDAREFFGQHAKEDLFIVSSCIGKTKVWDLEYQKEKVERSGVKDHVADCLVVLTKKVEAIRSLLVSGEPCVFVDDMERHLRDVREQLPEVVICQIVRDEAPASGDFPVIRSLTELDNVLVNV